jgi:hypothetical protein
MVDPFYRYIDGDSNMNARNEYFEVYISASDPSPGNPTDIRGNAVASRRRPILRAAGT